MTEPARQLTTDEAVGRFRALIKDEIAGMPPQTAEEAEAAHFRVAEHIIGLACPAPARCGDRGCRRDRVCRHLAQVRARRSAGRSSTRGARREPRRCAMRSGCTSRRDRECQTLWGLTPTRRRRP
jgi:hypothetical protein